jgi:hypothetical protein
MNIKMKLIRKFAIAAILLAGVAVLIPNDPVQAQFCYYCTTARTTCLNNCNALPPEEQAGCRQECYIGYQDCLAECPY